jgi:IMP dehydrogenase/GMP reductase
VDAIAERRRQAVVERETKERTRRERSAAAARERDLTKLAKRRTEAWRRVETLISTKRPADYDAAVTLLKDLREIGERTGEGAEVAKRIRALQESHAKKPSLLARMTKARLYRFDKPSR